MSESNIACELRRLGEYCVLDVDADIIEVGVGGDLNLVMPILGELQPRA